MTLLLTVLFLVLPVLSWADVTYIGKTDSTDTKNVSSVTTPVAVAAGTDRALVFCSQVRNAGSALHSLSTVVRNGQSFTFVRKDIRTAGDGPIQTEAWVLAAPTTGTANVVATYAGVNSQAIGNTITEWTGVSQTSPVDSHAGSNGTGTAVAATITTVADNAAIVDCAMGRPDAGLTVGAGQTMRTDRLIGNSVAPLINDGAGVSTVVPKTPAGDEVMNWTQAEAFQWASSAVSLTPTGGSDPEPDEPSQVTLTWTNGTDPGTPSSGIASTTIRRCQGPSCNATIAPAIGTRTFPLTSFVDTGCPINTTCGYSVFHTDGVNLVSTNHATVYVTTSGTPPDPLPTILNAVTDATGSTLTYGVTPTQIKVVTFTSSAVISSVIHEMTDFPSGRFTQTWSAGLQGVCFTPIGSTGLENSADNAYQCDNLTSIVGPVDTTPPVLSNCQPTTDLPAGTTEWTFSCDVNKPNTAARYDTTDAAYATLANTMALNSQTFSATKTGLTDGSTTTLYLRGATIHPFETTGDPGEEVPVVYPNTSSTVVTLTVAVAPGDVTPPGDVANLAGTVLGNAVSLTWDAASDAVSYQVYQSTDNVTFAPAGNPVGVTSIQLSLSFSTTYYWKVKAFDVVNNLSADFSNTVTKTTPAAPDIERPSDMEDLAVEVFVNSTRLTWTQGTDNSGSVFALLEYCEVATGQTDCANFSALSSPLTQTFLTPPNLQPGTRYCFRGQFSDPTGNTSLNYTTPVCETTATIGVGTPHPPLPFGHTRPAKAGSAAGTRPARP